MLLAPFGRGFRIFQINPNLQGSPFAADGASTLRVTQFRSGSDFAQDKLETVLEVLQNVGCNRFARVAREGS
jgi:hypothetical protein